MKIEQYSDKGFIRLHLELAEIYYRDKKGTLNLSFPPHGLIIKFPGKLYHISFESIMEDFFKRCEDGEKFPFFK